MASILLLNGPNLNLLGRREPDVYGTSSLKEIERDLAVTASGLGHELTSFQTNAEHEIVGRIHQAADDGTDFLLLNAAAFTHTSIAIRDALLGTSIPFVEIHLSNTFGRENFRHRSLLTDIAAGAVFGFGAKSYELALLGAHAMLDRAR